MDIWKTRYIGDMDERWMEQEEIDLDLENAEEDLQQESSNVNIVLEPAPPLLYDSNDR